MKTKSRLWVWIAVGLFSVTGWAGAEQDLGVTDAIVGFRDAYQPGPDTQPLQDKIDALNQFADEVVHKV